MAPRPKKRFRADEARQAMLAAGREILVSQPASTGLERVSMKEVIDRSGVPRGSAYRLFDGPSGPSENFRLALLTSLEGITDFGGTVAATTKIIEENAGVLDRGDPVEMAALLREVIRVGIQTNVHSFATNAGWRLGMASLATADASPTSSDPISKLHRDATQQLGVRGVALYEQIAALFGLRAKAPRTWNELGVLVNAIVEGTALRQPFDERLVAIDRNTGPNGEPQPWDPVAIAFEALLIVWSEPDPAAEHSADITNWLETS